MADAYELMLEHRFRHLVVSDLDGDLVGPLADGAFLRLAILFLARRRGYAPSTAAVTSRC